MASTPANHHIIILCGGSGPRLWPLSRAYHPKQFLQVLSSKSLLQQTIDRAAKVVPLSHIHIISHQKYKKLLNQHIKNREIRRNFILEPDKKNTMMAIVLAAKTIQQKHPQAVISSLPADHFINPVSQFKKDLVKAAHLAQSQPKIILIGTAALFPKPSYGYISAHKQIVTKFIEKPSPATAAKLVKAKALWNTGIYTFSINTLIAELSAHAPDYLQLFNQLNPAKPNLAYSKAPTSAIDTTISQKSKNLLVVTATFSWSDIGQWKSIYQYLKKDADNIGQLNSGQYLAVKSHNCLVHSPQHKLIGLVGVNNLAVIDTADGLLVCNLDHSFNVRDLVGQIVNQPDTRKFFLSKHDK